MTSSNRNNFRVTGPLWGESTGHRWIPLTKASDTELWCFFFISAWTNGWANNWYAGDLRRHHVHYDVTVMSWSMSFGLRVLSKAWWLSRWYGWLFMCKDSIDLSHKSHNVPVPYPTIHHFVTECAPVCTFLLKMVHCEIFVWCMVGFMKWVYSHLGQANFLGDVSFSLCQCSVMYFCSIYEYTNSKMWQQNAVISWYVKLPTHLPPLTTIYHA